MKIGCVFLQISNHEGNNYQKDDFFAPNAINSFKKWHPNIDIHHITNDNLEEYLIDLNVTEYYDVVGLIRIYIIRELLNQKGYDKIIMLGLDTFTCSYLDDFINNNTDDLICSSGPSYDFLKTEYWAPKTIEFEHNGNKYKDVDFINADVACFNSFKAANMLISKSIEFWTEHLEQGGMNYLHQNQNSLDIKVSIVDFPYIKAKSLYNVRSKGVACGGYQMVKGKVLNGRQGQVIGDVYPTSTYYVKDNKLYTKDHKQIKVFHYAEGLGARTLQDDQTYDEAVYEMKNIWFNEETKQFLKEQCNCIF